MDKLEEQLRAALARRSAPAGFAERVTSACGHAGAAGWSRYRTATYRALAAGLVLVCIGGAAYRHQGEAARAQVLAAIRITARHVNRIQTRVREVQP